MTILIIIVSNFLICFIFSFISRFLPSGLLFPLLLLEVYVLCKIDSKILTKSKVHKIKADLINEETKEDIKHDYD